MAGLIAGRDTDLTAPSRTGARVCLSRHGRGCSHRKRQGATRRWHRRFSGHRGDRLVVQHRTDNGMNHPRLNLSYGTNRSQWYGVDPLAFAVEQAWDAGIVVVAAAGNTVTRARDPRRHWRIPHSTSGSSRSGVRLDGHSDPDRRHDARLLGRRQNPRIRAGAGLRRSGRPYQGLRVPNLHRLTSPDAAMLRARFMRGQRHLGIRRDCFRSCRPHPRQVPARDAGPGQALIRMRPMTCRRRTAGGRGGELRLAQVPKPPALPKGILPIAPAVVAVPRALARIRSPDPSGVVLKGEIESSGSRSNRRHGRPRGRQERLGRRNVERQQLVGSSWSGAELVRLVVVRQHWSGSTGPARRGPAAAGPVPHGPAAAVSGSSWRAPRGPAAAGRTPGWN